MIVFIHNDNAISMEQEVIVGHIGWQSQPTICQDFSTLFSLTSPCRAVKKHSSPILDYSPMHKPLYYIKSLLQALMHRLSIVQTLQ